MRLLLQILSVLWALLLVLVGMRFLTLLIGANQSSELVQWVMVHSQFWVAPFFGIFSLADKSTLTHGGVIEFASLIAFIVYAVIGSVVFWAINAPFGGGGWYHRHRPLGI